MDKTKGSCLIVMTVSGRYELTRQALTSLCSSIDSTTKSNPLLQFATIVVDDIPSNHDDLDDLTDLFLNLKARPKFTVIKSGVYSKNLAKMKNYGFAYGVEAFWHSNSGSLLEFVLFCDNDVYFTNDWFLKMREVYYSNKHLALGVLGGQRHPYHLTKNKPSNNKSTVLYTDAVAGTSMFMSAPLALHYPFSKTTANGVGQSEDYELCQRLKRKGYGVGYIHPPTIIDTGLTQDDGKESPGAKEKLEMSKPGILYK